MEIVTKMRDGEGQMWANPEDVRRSLCQFGIGRTLKPRKDLKFFLTIVLENI